MAQVANRLMATRHEKVVAAAAEGNRRSYLARNQDMYMAGRAQA